MKIKIKDLRPGHVLKCGGLVTEVMPGWGEISYQGNKATPILFEYDEGWSQWHPEEEIEINDE